jgi:hypothetical protein
MRLWRGRIEVKVQKIPWPFPENVHAVTIWPFIFYEPQVWDDASVQVHERYHWADQIRWLVLPWFAAYLVLRPFYGGGDRHPLEREAYRRQRRHRDLGTT